jgi:hypothetical protein
VQVIIDTALSAVVQDTQAESLATCLQLVAGDVLPHFLQILNSPSPIKKCEIQENVHFTVVM